MIALINKLADWPPNFHKTARKLPKSSAPRHSTNKLTLNESAMKWDNGPIYYVISMYCIFVFLQPSCLLVQSKEITMQPADALRVFSTDNYATAVQRGRLFAVNSLEDYNFPHLSFLIYLLLRLPPTLEIKIWSYCWVLFIQWGKFDQKKSQYYNCICFLTWSKTHHRKCGRCWINSCAQLWVPRN